MDKDWKKLGVEISEPNLDSIEIPDYIQVQIKIEQMQHHFNIILSSCWTDEDEKEWQAERKKYWYNLLKKTEGLVASKDIATSKRKLRYR